MRPAAIWPSGPDEVGLKFSKTKRGFWLVHDGTHLFVGISMPRLHRFMRLGIAPRFNHLLRRYFPIPLPAPEGLPVINFGANAGEVAAALARTGMAGRIIAIEPDPNILPVLRANAEIYKFEVVPVAAWNTGGAIKLYLATETADTSFFNETDETVTVEALPIDAIMEDLGIDRVGVLVGDAEGAEPEVLEGARETMKRTHVVSVCTSKERNGEPTQEACEKLMKESGLEIVHRESKSFMTLVGVNHALG